jgi:radical SAM superfamily enzyme YgiQ (UPF0313 family)
MKILCVIPPYVPSYFNAGHHLPVFQVAAYLRARFGFGVVARDCGALNTNWRDICRLLAQPFDTILMLNDYDAIDGFERFLHYAREICPRARTATFGRASRDVPAFFDRFGLDAIGSSGDYECSMEAFLAHVVEGAAPRDLRVRQADGSYRTYPPGPWLAPEQWVLPDISEIPYPAYDRLYADDLNKFCGIPDRRELIVPVARGCPVGCEFCDVPRQQGRRERRLSVDSVVAYIRDSLDRQSFAYVSFYAPTFTLKRKWVIDLCDAFRDAGLSVPWKCVTTVAHLDEELIERMAAAGCVRVSVGVESFAPEAAPFLPKLKQNAWAGFARIAAAAAAVDIELNCFLMFGIPGEPPAQAITTMKALVHAGHRARPTVYTPYDQIRPDSSLAEFDGFNRQTFVGGELSPGERAELYAALYANDFDRPTEVAQRIPAAPAPRTGTSGDR